MKDLLLSNYYVKCKRNPKKAVAVWGERGEGVSLNLPPPLWFFQNGFFREKVKRSENMKIR